MNNPMQLSLVALVVGIAGCSSVQTCDDWPQYESNPFVIDLDVPAPPDDKGSIIVASHYARSKMTWNRSSN